MTGVHEAETSHFALLQAFAPRDLLDAAHAHADAAGYLGHEFGDAVLVLAGRDARRPAGARSSR